MKTARFGQVIQAAGKPALHLALTKVEKDAALMRAAKENRVLSVHQEIRGGKKDSGHVGVYQDGRTQFLVFPRSIGKFKERKIVGIDYDQIEQPASGPAPKIKAAEAGRRPKRRETMRSTREGEPPRDEGDADAADAASGLKNAIRRAIRELEGNNSVAAYKTLQAALRP